MPQNIHVSIITTFLKEIYESADLISLLRLSKSDTAEGMHGFRETTVRVYTFARF